MARFLWVAIWPEDFAQLFTGDLAALVQQQVGEQRGALVAPNLNRWVVCRANRKSTEEADFDDMRWRIYGRLGIVHLRLIVRYVSRNLRAHLQSKRVYRRSVGLSNTCCMLHPRKDCSGSSSNLGLHLHSITTNNAIDEERL